MVGCVIVYNDIIIGEGFHQYYGGPHAEVNAINSVKNKELLKESTLYVNLEPCVHFGKTPPCTDFILEHKISEVVISTLDSYNEVAGKGVGNLRKAGVNVTLGIMSDESRELNKRFFTYHEKKRPYIILKWAQTLDGYISSNSKLQTPNSNHITDEYSDILTHKWRSEEDSIIVGTNTAINDNPQLNVRNYPGRNLLRIVIDRNLRLPKTLNLFDKSQQTLVFTETNPSPQSIEKNLEYVYIDYKKERCRQILDVLYNKRIQSIIVEGGKILHESFINEGLWDEARVLIGNKSFGEGLQAPKLEGKIVSRENIGEDILLKYIKSQ